MQIRSRLTAQFIVLVAAISLAGFSIIYISSANYRKKEFYNRLRNKAITTAELFIKVDQVDSLLLKIIDSRQRDRLPDENISIYNYQNTEVYTNNDSLAFDIHDTQLDEVRLKEEKEFTEGKYEIIGLLYNDRFNRFVVFAGAYDKYGQSKLENLRNTLLVLFAIIVFIVMIGGWMYAGKALRPISAVIDQVERISPSNLSARLSGNKNEDEIGRLINVFNKLLARIDEAFSVQRLFVASASHELKNPLTVITSQLEVGLLNERDATEYKRLIRSVLEDIKDLNKLTIQLMELARVSYDSQDIMFKGARVDEVIWDVKEFIEDKHSEYNVDFKILALPENEDELYFQMNEALLKTAFINIVENGCKFSSDRSVEISLSYDPSGLYVAFKNNGEHINDEERKLIFEPFYRRSSSSKIQGHGIGLALVKKIVEIHRASIFVDSSRNGEIVFVVTFPSTSKHILI